MIGLIFLEFAQKSRLTDRMESAYGSLPMPERYEPVVQSISW